MVSRLVWVVESLFLVRTSYNEISSTYFHMLVTVDEILRLLTMTRNKIGPSLVPWGTPAFTGSHAEIASPSLTRWRRFDRKLIIHGIKDLLTPKSISFPISMLWPMRSNAFEKSRKIRRRCLPGDSKCKSQVWIISRRHYVIEVPFRHPNWSGSILSLMSAISHWTTKSSRVLDRQGVNEIGLVSPSLVGGCVFKMGVMLEFFHISGTVPDVRDALKMAVTGSANS